MTSRESTGYWVQTDENVERSFTDKLSVFAFGLIQWPWLLKSLYGGRLVDKIALLDRLNLPHDALPNLGSWKADTCLLHHIVDAIELLRPKNVVELGCGASSLVIAKALKMFGGGRLNSYDQHADFVAATAQWLEDHDLDADFHHAPLGKSPKGWPGHWYQLQHLPAQIDLIVIDGPPWAIHPFVRGGAETLFNRLTPGGMILLDDAARPGERIIAHNWARLWPGIEFVLDTSGTKGTLIGRRKR